MVSETVNKTMYVLMAVSVPAGVKAETVMQSVKESTKAVSVNWIGVSENRADFAK